MQAQHLPDGTIIRERVIRWVMSRDRTAITSQADRVIPPEELTADEIQIARAVAATGGKQKHLDPGAGANRPLGTNPPTITLHEDPDEGPRRQVM